MAMNQKQRRKHAQAAQKLVPTARVTGYAIGRSGSNPVVVVAAMLGTVVVVSGLLIALTGSFVLPGIIPMLIIQHFISPPRAVVIADQGVALATRSVWTGKPNDLVSVMGHGYVQPVEESLGRVKVGIGNATIWMSKGEEAVLRDAVSQQLAPPTGPVPPSPYAG